MATNRERIMPLRIDVVKGTSGNKNMLISETIKTGKIKITSTKGNFPVQIITSYRFLFTVFRIT